ncbi:hypothetical protein SLEP1_g20563 [Rubroshorea leprosula]|uniref:Uncharacterized protein n=1 Tax=Rubroshorea leprosula TaxID=152421 RepID=A0AAV5J6C8_9ROSI|nr:hypothetical protein SLEP1_g20563 [Rubroshorea leprosula]
MLMDETDMGISEINSPNSLMAFLALQNPTYLPIHIFRNLEIHPQPYRGEHPFSNLWRRRLHPSGTGNEDLEGCFGYFKRMQSSELYRLDQATLTTILLAGDREEFYYVNRMIQCLAVLN